MTTHIQQQPIERTRPWAADEYIRVNGRSFVYTRSPSGPIVRFYGGRSEAVADLILRGAHVELPMRER